MSFHGAIARRCITLVVLAAGPSLWPPLSAQTIGGYERGRGHLMLRAVRERLEKDYYDPTFHGLDLRVAAARADSQIQAAESNGQIFRIIAGFVQTLHDSHTRFYPPRRTADVEYGWESQMIGDSCYVVWIDPKSDAAAKGLIVGDRVMALERYQPTRRYFSLLQYLLYVVDPRPVLSLDVEGADGSRHSLEVEAKSSPASSSWRGEESWWETAAQVRSCAPWRTTW
jgi:hypothetical protein